MIASQPGVTLLLGLHNGAACLGAQLDSFAGQQHRNWSLIVSDDGSCDDGPEILHRFAARHPGRDIALIAGPRAGFARNFLHLLCAAGRDTPYAALSDQDDIWLPEKLARAQAALAQVPAGQPALYGSRSWVWDAESDRRHASPLFRRPPSFANALLQSIAGGNTMMLNRAALDLVQDASLEPRDVIAHDWWLYQIVSGAGGRVIYDREPTLLYRQHAANQIGANRSARAGLVRLRLILGGRYRRWTDTNLAALTASEARFSPENRALLLAFRTARAAPARARIAQLHRLGLHRQHRRETAALWLAAAAGLL